MSNRRSLKRFTIMKSILFLGLVTSVALGATPPVETPSAYRDASPAWKTAEPAEQAARGEWWRLFNDPELDALEDRAIAANQDLRAAAARVEEARASAGIARSNGWPQVAANGSVTRE